jgi:hypothetical protein
MKKELIAIAITAFALLFLPIATTTNPVAVYAQTEPPEDVNGVRYMQPLAGYTLTYGDECFVFDENFRDDGSMRMDFTDETCPGISEWDSVNIVGYFNLENGAANSNFCEENTDEEISAILNGGPHTESDPPPATPNSITPYPNENYADAMDLGISNMAGDESRVRWEKTHPIFSSGIPSPTPLNMPLASNLCDLNPGSWVGVQGFKLNRDTDCIGGPNRVQLIGVVDKANLNLDGTPKNSMAFTYSNVFRTQAGFPDSVMLKRALDQWTDAVAGHPEDVQQTIRIDNQSQQAWLDNTNESVYRYVALREVTSVVKNTCSQGAAEAMESLSSEELAANDIQSEQEEEETAVVEAPAAAAATNEVETTNEDNDQVTQSNEEELAQQDVPQDPDNNDITADTDTATTAAEQEEEEDNSQDSDNNN